MHCSLHQTLANIAVPPSQTLLEAHTDALQAGIDAILVKETLLGSELADILNAHPPKPVPAQRAGSDAVEAAMSQSSSR